MKKIKTDIHVWHVEMTERKVYESLDRPYELKKAEVALPELNRFMYATVGAPWKWYMRLEWNWQRWNEYLSKPTIETWVAYKGATPIGYFELDRQPSGSTEIVYFGLIPQFVGKGFGKAFLEDCINTAWSENETRIWLHTCTLDHPNALPNYLGRGFKVFKEEDFEDLIPAEPLKPWPGA